MSLLDHECLLKEICPWPNSASDKFNLIQVVSADVHVCGRIASWKCDLCSCTRPHSQKDFALD